MLKILYLVCYATSTHSLLVNNMTPAIAFETIVKDYCCCCRSCSTLNNGTEKKKKKKKKRKQGPRSLETLAKRQRTGELLSQVCAAFVSIF